MTDFAEVAREGEDALRSALRPWLAEHRRPELDGLDGWKLYEHDGPGEPTIETAYGAGVAAAYRAWEKDLLGVNLVCPHWEVEFGGAGFGPVEMAVVDREFDRAGMPRVLRGMGEVMLGPTLILQGTPEQRDRYLPRIITGEDRWCQGFSEPDSGSDLGSLKTRGVVDGDELVLDGQKVWTSGASRANMIFVLCRTDPAVPKHKGITYVVLPMDTPGIEVRPIHQITGTAEFFETFFTAARAPLANVVGALGEGWRVAMSTLEHERNGLFTAWCIQFERDVRALLDALGARRSDPLTRQRMASLVGRSRLLQLHGDRILDAERQGTSSGVLPLLSKLLWSDAMIELGEAALALRGPASMLRPPGPDYLIDRWQDIFLWSRGFAIAAGTSEVQRNVIAERGLGMPREPKEAREPKETE